MEDTGPDVETIGDPILSELMSEKFVGRALNLPNRFMELSCRLKDLSPEIVDIWKTEAEEIELYERYGKQIADHYLKLPEFKHKDLIVFGGWYVANLGMKISAMIMALKIKALGKKAA